jgi:hypothetical protein
MFGCPLDNRLYRGGNFRGYSVRAFPSNAAKVHNLKRTARNTFAPNQSHVIARYK